MSPTGIVTIIYKKVAVLMYCLSMCIRDMLSMHMLYSYIYLICGPASALALLILMIISICFKTDCCSIFNEIHYRKLIMVDWHRWNLPHNGIYTHVGCYSQKQHQHLNSTPKFYYYNTPFCPGWSSCCVMGAFLMDFITEVK